MRLGHCPTEFHRSYNSQFSPSENFKIFNIIHYYIISSSVTLVPRRSARLAPLPPCFSVTGQLHQDALFPAVFIDPCAEISNLPILLKVWHWTYFVLSFASSFMEGSHINTKLSDLHHWLRYPRLARFGTTRHLSLTYTRHILCRGQDGGTSPVERKPRAV